MGVVAPLGEKGLSALRAEIAAADDAAVPAAAKQAIALLGREAERIEVRLRAIDVTLMRQHKANPTARRLAAIPGIGPIGALNFALRVDPTQFASARHFAAWLGLVPRECSTAGKPRLGGISRAGDERLRQLLVPGATAVIRHANPRVMCGWPPACKDFFAYLHRRPIAVMCPAWWRGARPQALMGSVDRGLIKPAGSRCPMTRDRYPSIRRLTDDAITLLHPRKSCVSEVLFLCSIKRPFLRPDLVSEWRRAQPRSRLAEGHRRRRREAVLTAASTAPD
jgi:hypothetical protein